MARTAARVLAIALTLAGGNHRLRAATEAPPICAAGDTVPSQIRPMGCQTAMAMANGMVRSATLRRMVDRVGELNGIVYIEDRYYVNERTGRVLSGALSHHITVAGAHRVLHLLVAPEAGNRQLTTIAHELQHAIEVLEAPEVKSDAAVDRLFERIGVNTSAGVMETQAALDVERAVGRELSAERSSSNASIGTVVEPIGALVDAGAIESQHVIRISIDQDGGLSAAQLRWVVAEVKAIWTLAGVAVVSGRYGDPVSGDVATISLRILLSRTRHNSEGEPALAWVPATETERYAPVLFVSLAAVTEAVMGAEALGRPVARLTRDLQHRLVARAIGRVTAHEIGHYLLQTARHENRGLMRESYSSSDLVGSVLEPFMIATAEQSVVRQQTASLTRLQSVEQAALIRTRLLAAGASEIK